MTAAAGVDENPVWGSLYFMGLMHCLSMGILMPLKSWLPGGLFHCVVAAGVHCQPFSRMGDAQGMSDCRSQSLPKGTCDQLDFAGGHDSPRVCPWGYARCWFPRGPEAVFIADRVPA